MASNSCSSDTTDRFIAMACMQNRLNLVWITTFLAFTVLAQFLVGSLIVDVGEKYNRADSLRASMKPIPKQPIEELHERSAHFSSTEENLEKNPAATPYQSIEELHGRSTRFPSIEERVKYYMTNWYTPPCEDDPTATVQYKVFRKEDSRWRKALVRELANSTENLGHVVEIDSEIEKDVLMMLEPDMLKDKHRPHRGYRTDMVESFLPVMNSLEEKPLLMQWGDRVSFHLKHSKRRSFAVPYIKKCRPALAKGELERVTAAKCHGADRPRARSVRGELLYQPIIWKLDSHRLSGEHDKRKANIVLSGQGEAKAELDKPWSEKVAKGVFRGQLTGHAFVNGTRVTKRDKLTDEEYCNAITRCRFVVKYRKSNLVDACLVGLMGKHLNPTVSGVDLLGKPMGMLDLLDYKVLIMMEGNDVSSGLRWALRSNSVVMMPPPTFASWAMEDLLEPWVHYIPLDPSFNDTEQKMQWVLDHDEEAERIAHQGSLWIKDLVEHPDSERENTEVNKRMLERYQKLFVHPDRLETEEKKRK